jgi:hypothetical protein
MQHHRRIALLSCSITAAVSACTMASTRPEQLVAPDAAVSAPHEESTGMSQSDGSGGVTSHAPAGDASAMHGSGGAASAPANDAGSTTMKPSPGMPSSGMHASSSDASVPDSLDADIDAGPQPLPECAANFAVEVTACLLLDPTNKDCTRLADHCGLTDASPSAAVPDGGKQP